MANKDVTDKVERMEAFEERMGVRLDCLSARSEYFDDETTYVRAMGELLSRRGDQLPQDIALVAAVYSNGRVVGTSENYYNSDEFPGLETFELIVSIPAGLPISKVRIYPKSNQ